MKYRKTNHLDFWGSVPITGDSGSAGGGSNLGAVASSRAESSAFLQAAGNRILRIECHRFNLVANPLEAFFNCINCLPSEAATSGRRSP